MIKPPVYKLVEGETLAPPILAALRTALSVFHALTIDEPIQSVMEEMEIDRELFTISITRGGATE